MTKQKVSFSVIVPALDRNLVSVIDTPNTRDKRRMARLVSWQEGKFAKGPKRHAGRDEVEIRYPVRYFLRWIPDIRLRRIPQ